MTTSSLPALTLILGGQRSGKSAVAERLVGDADRVVYIATCRRVADDADMAARIEAHQARRPGHWTVVEEPLDLAGTLLAANGPKGAGGHAVLVDSIGMWAVNLLAAGDDVSAATDAVVATFSEMTAPVVMVAEEVGLGVIPDNAAARAFVDAMGMINQRLADAAAHVALVVAGQELTIKDTTQ